MRYLVFLFTSALFAQSNAIQLCDQQATRHCFTLKAPATLASDVVCTLGASDLGVCSGSVANGFAVTGQTAFSSRPDPAISGLQVFYDPSGHAAGIHSTGSAGNLATMSLFSNSLGLYNKSTISGAVNTSILLGASQIDVVGPIASVDGATFASLAVNGIIVSTVTGSSNAFSAGGGNLLIQGNGNILSFGYADTTGYKIAGTAVIDGSRNAAFAGLTAASLTLPITGSTQCLQANTSGVISGSGSPCPNQALTTTSSPTFASLAVNGIVASTVTGTSNAFSAGGGNLLIQGNGNILSFGYADTTGYKISGTTVIDGSQNASFTGLSATSVGSLSVGSSGNFYMRSFFGTPSCSGVSNGWMGYDTSGNRFIVCNSGIAETIKGLPASHLSTPSASGTGCTSPSVSGNDMRGTINCTGGVTSGSDVVLSFAGTYTTSPVCVASGFYSSGFPFGYATKSVNTSSATFIQTSGTVGSSVTISYVCFE